MALMPLKPLKPLRQPMKVVKATVGLCQVQWILGILGRRFGDK
jgi:hypothetical protein